MTDSFKQLKARPGRKISNPKGIIVIAVGQKIVNCKCHIRLGIIHSLQITRRSGIHNFYI